MKKLTKWLKDIFEPGDYNDLDIGAISSAMNDFATRLVWLRICLDDLKALNMEVDKRLLTGSEMGLIDLCARRKAYQDILEAVLTARRQVTQTDRPNPLPRPVIDLDRVTA